MYQCQRCGKETSLDLEAWPFTEFAHCQSPARNELRLFFLIWQGIIYGRAPIFQLATNLYVQKVPWPSADNVDLSSQPVPSRVSLTATMIGYIVSTGLGIIWAFL